MDLDGRIVLVTGASRGIGRAVAETVAARGARVGLVARSATDLDEVLHACGGRGVIATADVGDAAEVDAAVRRVEAELGPVDALVANAGIGLFGPLVEVDLAAAERVIRTNVLGTLYTLRAVVPGMVERGRGAVVVVGSIAGRIGAPYEAVYSASKFAQVGMAEALSVEVAPRGVRVATVDPGPVQTDFFDARGHPYDRKRPAPVPAQRVADAVVRAIEHDRPQQLVPGSLRGAVVARHLLPPLYRWGTRLAFRGQQ